MMYSHWKSGKLSGFPNCCNSYFHVTRLGLWRIPFLKDIWIKIGKLGVFNPKDKFRHVACPFHSVAYKLNLYEPKYHSCEECGWQQLFVEECSLKDVHETEVRIRIKLEYLEQIHKHGYVKFIYGDSKISNKLLKELKQD